MTSLEAAITIGAVVLGTVLTRALPFICFPENKKTPDYIVYLGKALPYAVIGLLVVYCLKGISVTAFPFGLPEAIAVAAVVLLHLWRKSTFLSIGGGTVIYMLLVQVIFR